MDEDEEWISPEIKRALRTTLLRSLLMCIALFLSGTLFGTLTLIGIILGVIGFFLTLAFLLTDIADLSDDSAWYQHEHDYDK